MATTKPMDNGELPSDNSQSHNSHFSQKFKHYQAQKKTADSKANLLKEMELIQTVINRMANTSFLIKGWAITMMGFIFTFQSNTKGTLLIIIPLLLFWLIDTYFLQQERLYRRLYTWVIQNRLTDDSHLFSLSTARFQSEKKPFFQVMFSMTLGAFYGGAIILLLVAYFVFFVYFVR